MHLILIEFYIKFEIFDYEGNYLKYIKLFLICWIINHFCRKPLKYFLATFLCVFLVMNRKITNLFVLAHAESVDKDTATISIN